MPIRRIMMPIEIGDQPAAVGAVVASLARTLDAEVLLFHAMTRDLEKYGEPYLFANRSRLETHAKDVAKEAFERVRASDDFRGLRTATRFLKARHAATAIVDSAASGSVDLIVMPNLVHAKDRVRKVLLGSVTERVLRETGTPLLICPTSWQDAPSAADIAFKTIAAPTDLSDAAHEAFPSVAEIAAAYDAQVTLLHVIEQSVPLSFKLYGVHSAQDLNPAFREKVAAHLESVAEEHFADRECSVHLRIGKPSTAISRFVEHNKAHLIVMGTQGNDSVGDVILGSTTERVVRTACAPMLIIPAAGTARSKVSREVDLESARG